MREKVGSSYAYDAAAFVPSAVIGSAAEELMVCRLFAGGNRIRTSSSARESAVKPDVGKGDAARPEVGKAADGGQMAWSIRRWRLEVFGSSYGDRRSDCASRISRRRFLIKGVERSASFRLK